MSEGGDREKAKLVAAVTEHLFEGVVGGANAALRIDHEHSQRRALEDRPEDRLLVEERL
jgi:hypothetical protein